METRSYLRKGHFWKCIMNNQLSLSVLCFGVCFYCALPTRKGKRKINIWILFTKSMAKVLRNWSYPANLKYFKQQDWKCENLEEFYKSFICRRSTCERQLQISTDYADNGSCSLILIETARRILSSKSFWVCILNFWSNPLKFRLLELLCLT